LHPGEGNDVTFRATVVADQGRRITAVELLVYEARAEDREVQVTPDITIVRKLPIPNMERWGLAQRWEPGTSGPIDLVHRYGPANPNTRVYYHWVAYTSNSRKTEVSASFDPAQATFDDGLTLLYQAGTRNTDKRMNLAFLPDEDYDNDVQAMMNDLEHTIYQGFHQSTMIRGQKPRWAFYASPMEGNYEATDDFSTVTREVPDELLAIPWLNALAIVHRSDIRDSRSGRIITTEANSIGTAVHEASHAIFNLRDEYCGRGSCGATEPHPNRFDNEADCRSYNLVNRWPADDCNTCTGSTPDECWRPEPASDGCIMRASGHTVLNQHARTCAARALHVYSEQDR